MEMKRQSENVGAHPPLAAIPGEMEGQFHQPPNEEFLALTANVFGIDLIREIIVDYTIIENNISLDRSSVRFLRVLGKSWNDSVCKVVQKHRLPIFKLSLTSQGITLNDIRGCDQCAQFLDQLTKIFAESSLILGHIPTYQLTLWPHAFKQENYESLYNFLLYCGQGLVDIALFTPRNGDSMNGLFPSLSLPLLKTAGFCLRDHLMDGRDGHSPSSDSITYLLQTIFCGSKALRCLRLKDDITQHSHFSNVFKSIVLPPTLTKINLLGDFRSEDLELLLVKSFLPNLENLRFPTLPNPMGAELLKRILENVRKTLKKLTLFDASFRECLNTANSVVLQFPVMEKLVILKIFSQLYKLEPRSPSMETYLPKLRDIYFFDQSRDTIRKWTLSPSSMGEKLSLNSRFLPLSFHSEYVSQIQLAFPKITILELKFPDYTAAGLQCMFQKLTSLVELKIIKVSTASAWELAPGSSEPPFDWDSVLIGTPVEFAAGLRASPSLWENIQLNNDEDPSIRKLTELRTLSIKDYTDCSHRVALLTDVAFHFGFLKMPRLQKLEFSGTVMVSTEIAEKWQRTGRLLNCTNIKPHGFGTD